MTMRKALALFLATCMTLVLLVGCASSGGSTSAAASAGSAAAGSGSKSYAGQTLYVANWQAYNSDTTYCEQAFEDKFGCTVEHVYYNSYDELMTNLQTGGNKTIDCVMVSQNYTQYFHDAGLIMTVDPGDIPNYQDVASTYKDVSPYAVDDKGNVFAFPWTTGVTSLAYNPDYVDFDIEHWSDLLNPKLKGHVCLYGDYGDGMIIGALISGQDPTDPSSLDLDKVAAALEELKPQILSFWGSSDEQLMTYYSGENWAGNMWSGPYAQLKREGKNVKMVHPSEGTIGYLDYWCVVDGTDQYDLACEWINWIESYEEQYTMATGEGTDYKSPDGSPYPTYAPVNQKVRDGLTEDQKIPLGMDPMPTKICMLNYLTPEQKDAWTDTWDTFKASVG